MPTFREWVVHHPSDWTQPQKQQYMGECVNGLSAALNPMMLAVGPARVAHILCTLIVGIGRQNPVWVETIKDGMANAFDLLEKMNTLPVATTTKH